MTREPTSWWITWTFVILLVYASLWAYFPDEMQPKMSGFSLVITLICCYVSEDLVGRIPTPEGFPPVPKLLASLLVGLALRNLPAPCNPAIYIHDETSKKLRELALTVILTAAGLEIDPEAMKKVKYAVLRLAFTPCLFETTAYGILAHYLLGFPYGWSFMMGFMISAVSPAVVVPSLIIIQQKKFGVKKGVPSLVMAASGIDDVLAIAGFTVLLGVNIPVGIEKDIIAPDTFWDVRDVVGVNATTVAPTTEDFNIGREIGGAILEVVVGGIAGIIMGIIVGNFPPKTMQYRTFCRGTILLLNGILWVFGTEHWGIEGAGAISALIMSFTAASMWGEERHPLAHGWEHMWTLFQPILFGLTGAMVDVNTFDAETVGYGFICIIVALLLRMCVAVSVPWGLGFNKKERAFVGVSWVPKGTVQAALGSAALDLAKMEEDTNPDHKDHMRWGQQILVLAVLATLFTAPIGAIAISFFGTKLLQHDDDDDPEEDQELGKVNKAYDDDKDSAVMSESSSSYEMNGKSHHRHLDGIKEEDAKEEKTGF